MPSIPLPFVGAMMLAVLLLRMVGPWHRTQVDKPSLVFVAACIGIELLSGLRWSTNPPLLHAIQPVLAGTLPPLAWVCFVPTRPGKVLHLIPVMGIGLLALFWQGFLDVGLAAVYIGYGTALLRLAFRGPDAFPDIRLGEAESARQLVISAGLLLLGLAATDMFVAADFRLERGVHAASIVAVANVLILIFVALAIASVGNSRPAEDEQVEPPSPPAISHSDVDIAGQIDALMRDKQLFRDPDLTLQRLARRARIPARQISAALNRVHGRNVSQVVNDYRIEMAKRLLLETDASITHIQFESGFQTKSNFNREFRRVTGKNPRDWRSSAVTETSNCLPENR